MGRAMLSKSLIQFSIDKLSSLLAVWLEAKLSTHASIGNLWTLTGKSGSVSYWLLKSNFLGVLIAFAGSPGWEICCGS